MDMTCSEFRAMLENRADLSEKDIRMLEEHSAHCPECASELRFVRSVTDTLKNLPMLEVPEDFRSRLNEKIDEIDEENRRRRFAPVWRGAAVYAMRYGAMAACLAVGIAIGLNGNTLVSKMNNTDDVISTQNGAAQERQKTPGDETVAETAVQPESAAVGNEPARAAASVSSAPSASVSTSAGADVSPAAHRTADEILKENQGFNPYEAYTPYNAAGTRTQAQNPPAVYSQPQVYNEPSGQAVAASQPQTAAETSAGQTAQSASVGDSYADAGSARSGGGLNIYSYSSPSDDLESYSSYPSAGADSIYASADSESGYHIDNSALNFNTPLGSSLMINEKDAPRVKEIMDVFIAGTYGDYYMITSDDMAALLKQMENEGIYYRDFMHDSGNKITFRLVIT